MFLNGRKVEVDEIYIGGKRKNMSNAKRKALAEAGASCGAVGKAPVMSIRSCDGEIRATPVARVDKPTLQGEIRWNVAPGSTVYSDENASYRGMREYRHEAVTHSTSEYVRGQIHTNGVESFWALLKCGYHGSYQKMSVKHLSRYLDEFQHRWNHRDQHAVEFI